MNMEINDIIEIGDWIATDEGYATVLKIHPIYYDIYCPEVYDYKDLSYFQIDGYFEVLDESMEKAIKGELQTVKLLCKRFCKFDGTPIKSHKIRCFDKEYCAYVNEEDMEIINNAIRKYPKEYSSFQKLNKGYETYFEIAYLVKRDGYWQQDENLRQFPEWFNENIMKQMPDSFTATELCSFMKEKNCPFRLDQPVPYEGLFYPKTYKKILLIFFFEIGKYRDNQILFEFVRIGTIY
jgi:hypothetical protein